MVGVQEAHANRVHTQTLIGCQHGRHARRDGRDRMRGPAARRRWIRRGSGGAKHSFMGYQIDASVEVGCHGKAPLSHQRHLIGLQMRISGRDLASFVTQERRAILQASGTCWPDDRVARGAHPMISEESPGSLDKLPGNPWAQLTL